MAHGLLGGLGTPGEVVGVDISEGMVSHCRAHHQTAATPGLSFHQLDVTRPEPFCEENFKRFSCLTSFSCLHWVANMPAAVRLFNNVCSRWVEQWCEGGVAGSPDWREVRVGDGHGRDQVEDRLRPDED